MKKTHYVAIAATTLITSISAHAQSGPKITVIPWVAPNIFGSPSFLGAENNQYTAVRTGASSAGTPGTPTYYQAISAPIGYGNIIATNFNSWKGVANPGSPFESELGNRIHYGLSIVGNDARFSISQLTFATDGNDPGGAFDLDFGTGYEYSPYDGTGGFVGIQKGADGILGTADDVFVTSGPSTQLVDALIGRGSGLADAVYCGPVADTSGPCGAGNQGYIDAEIAAIRGLGFSSLTGTYSLLRNATPYATGAATVNFVANVPEPATWAMMIIGFGAVGAAMRRKATVRVRFA